MLSLHSLVDVVHPKRNFYMWNAESEGIGILNLEIYCQIALSKGDRKKKINKKKGDRYQFVFKQKMVYLLFKYW